MKRILICDTFMFVAYAVNIICLALFVINLPQKAREVRDGCVGLSKAETSKIHSRCIANYSAKPTIATIASLVISIAMSILDGISGDPDNMTPPFVVLFIMAAVLLPICRIFYSILKKKYNLLLYYVPSGPLSPYLKNTIRCIPETLLIWIGTSLLFSINTSIVVQTILILTGCYA